MHEIFKKKLVRALLANSKVPGSSSGGMTDDFFSFVSGMQVLSFGEKRAVRRHVASNFLIL